MAVFCFHQAGDDGGNQTMGWMDCSAALRCARSDRQGGEKKKKKKSTAPLKGGFHPLSSLSLSHSFIVMGRKKLRKNPNKEGRKEGRNRAASFRLIVSEFVMRPMGCWMPLEWRGGMERAGGGPHRVRGANSIEMRDRENGMRGRPGQAPRPRAASRIYESTNRWRERGVRDPGIAFSKKKYK